MQLTEVHDRTLSSWMSKWYSPWNSFPVELEEKTVSHIKSGHVRQRLLLHVFITTFSVEVTIYSRYTKQTQQFCQKQTLHNHQALRGPGTREDLLSYTNHSLRQVISWWCTCRLATTLPDYQSITCTWNLELGNGCCRFNQHSRWGHGGCPKTRYKGLLSWVPKY